jgi:anti-sigma B factor antagonist
VTSTASLPPVEFAVISERRGRRHRIVPRGELDIANSPELERELRRVEETDAAVIDVDLAEVTFIDSAGIHVLALASAREPVRLLLGAPSSSIRRVLAISGAERQLRIASPRIASPVSSLTRVRRFAPPSAEARYITEWSA